LYENDPENITKKILEAAIICKDMVEALEHMDTIPGYILYDEVAEEVPESTDVSVKEDEKTGTSETKEQTKNSDITIKGLTEIKEELKEQKDKILKEMNKAAEGESDDEPGANPDEIFKGKKVKEFICFELNQMKSEQSLEFDWFDVCVDLYFTQIDKQKEETKLHQKEAEIYKKMNRIKDDQLKRIEGLQKEQDLSLSKAKLLQKNIGEVQAIIEILTALSQSGLQWKEIWRMVKEEKRAGNPLANLIQGLDLEHDRAYLLFNVAEMSNKDVDDFYTEAEEIIILKIDLDLALSAQANIQKYFEIKKKTQTKEYRTKDKANEAIKQAEDQARKALVKTRNEQKLKTTRKPFWFEKYDWFISSENYLIISGQNAQQNEEIVKTYLDKKDIYVHSEMAGSASCIVKNPSLEEISPLTLSEVGTWSICHCKAWDAKIVTSAYWVWGDQVSKTPQSGEYLVQGSFMIRGKKNYLHPQRLELGATIMFRLADDSIANHLHERQNRMGIGEDEVQPINESMDYQDRQSEQNQIDQIDEVDEVNIEKNVETGVDEIVEDQEIEKDSESIPNDEPEEAEADDEEEPENQETPKSEELEENTEEIETPKDDEDVIQNEEIKQETEGEGEEITESETGQSEQNVKQDKHSKHKNKVFNNEAKDNRAKTLKEKQEKSKK
jgi:predicted ribosome quality control (RQC) complex YloA/Tae2 family protein